jgi:hypothetical protein
MTAIKRIKPKERDTVLQSLRAGVVPRLGLQHIQVGRSAEIQALLQDIERIADGGSGIRFVIGEYGSGKTFFMHLVRSIALEKSLVTAHADLAPDRRLHATGGQARNLYAELMRNLSTRTKPDGAALSGVVERFIGAASMQAAEQNQPVEQVIHQQMVQLQELVGGYDFAQVIIAYWKGHDSGNEQLKIDAVRWLRGEFATKTEARNALGVRTIVDDANVYDMLKLMARFIQLAGYKGLLVGIDELVNLYKLSNTQARTANYEQILRIINDCLQGVASGIGFVMCGTPELLMDTRRGLYSYQALQSRLAENSFARSAGITDTSGPTLRLAQLTPEDLYVLLRNLRHVFAAGDPAQYLLPDTGIQAFMAHCDQRIGAAYFQTPRNVIKAFVDLLAVLDQQAQLSWEQLLPQIEIAPDVEDNLMENIADEETSAVATPPLSDDDELAEFKL